MSRAQTQIEPGALDRATWPARDVAAERTALAIMRWSISINVVASMGTASTALIPAAYTYLQQGAALSMWALLIYASAFVRPTLRLGFNLDLLAVVAFYAFAALSVLWTDRASATIMKSAALAVTSFGAFCLVTRVDVDDIVTSTIRGLSILAVASVCAAVFAPKIGVDQSWMHKGQWQGVFQSKQELGFLGAYLMFFSFYRKTIGQSWPIFLVTFLLGAICVITSESRGAGALAVMACAVLFTSVRSVKCMKVYAVLPFAMCLVAGILILYFYCTGYDAIYVFHTSIDFTERTYIWQYALSHFDDAPLFGFGLDGFWTIPAVYDYFEQNHGWVLDNFHSGYITILIETGFVGFVLFSGSVFLYARKVLYLISARSIHRSHCALIIGFFVLSFQINFTETEFLRSTTFTSVLLIAFFFAICRPVLPQRAELP